MSEFQELATVNSTGLAFPQETGLESGGGLTNLGINRSPEGTASTLEEQSAFLNLEGVEKPQYQPATIIPFAQFSEISSTDPNSAVGEGGQDWLTGGTETVPLVGTVQFFGSTGGSGSGYGDQGSIDGDDALGWGNSSGYGYGSSGTEAQFGSGYGSGYGSSGSNPGSGYGTGYGSGYDSSGFGYGSPNSGSGYGTGYGSGSGYGTGYGTGYGSGYGTGSGSGYGSGTGYGSGYGSGSGSGGSDDGSGSGGQLPIEPLPFIKSSGDAPAPIITWSQQTNSKPKKVLDSKGNAYIAQFAHDGTGWIYTLSKFDKSGSQLWSRSPEALSAVDWDKGAELVVDADDNLYAIGKASLSAADFQNASASNYTLVKYDSDGNLIWHRVMDAGTELSLVLTNKQGQIYVAGTVNEHHEQQYGNIRHIPFLAAYDDRGNQLWKRQFDAYTVRDIDFLYGLPQEANLSVGDSISANVRLSSLILDQQGNAYIAALTDPTIVPGLVAGDGDALLVKIDNSGNLAWRRQFGIITPNPYPQFAQYPVVHSDIPYDISVDRQGNVYVGGTSYGGGYSITNPSGVTGFITKFDSEGNQQWLQQLGSSQHTNSYSDLSPQNHYRLLFDGYNELLVVGDADILIGENEYGSLMYEDRILIAKYDTAGNQLWEHNLKGSDVKEAVLDEQRNYHISVASGYMTGRVWTQPESGDTWKLTIPDRLSLVLEQSLTQVSGENAGAIADQLPILAQISSRLLDDQSFPSEAAYKLVRQYLDNLWGGLFSRLEQIHTVASDILATAQQFQAFLSTAGQSFEQLAFVTKLLYGISRIPELADNLDNLVFINAFVDLGRTYAAVQSDTNAPKSPFDFFFDIWRAKSEADLGVAAAEFQTLLQRENFYSLISTRNLSLPAISRSFSIPTEDVSSLVQALENENYSHGLLDSYQVLEIQATTSDPTKLITVDVRTNLVGNASYETGKKYRLFRSGTELPYNLVIHGDELTYNPQGSDVYLNPGDWVLLPLPDTSSLPLSLIESYLADQVIEPLLATNKTIGQFILGAVYQFLVDQGETVTTLASLDPGVRQALEAGEQGTEALLPDTVGFEAGRLFGNGAAIVTGILEILAGISIGTGGTGAGGLLALTGGGALPGAAIAAVSVAVGSGLVLQGAGSVQAGVEGILERTGTLLAVMGGDGESQNLDDSSSGIPEPPPSGQSQSQELVSYENFSLRESKWDYFFGRVTSSPANQARSIQNRNDLSMLGIDESNNGRQRLLQIFEQGLESPEVAPPRTDQYGITLTRRIEISNGEIRGDITIRYLYRGGDLSSIPEITSIIPRIFNK